jgi:hypothetical protein
MTAEPVATTAPGLSSTDDRAAPKRAVRQDSARIRLEGLLLVGLVTFVCLVAFLTVTPWPVGAFQDDAIYTLLAKALATGEGYRMINLPGEPHATHYPPGYPFFLSLLWRLSPSFPDNIVLFKFANAVWLSLAALGAAMFARRRLAWETMPSALAATAGTLAIVVLLVTGVVLSEPMFMALLFPALLLGERAVESGSVRLAVAAGLACGLLALVRTLGTVVVPAVLLMLLFHRQWKAFLAFSAAAAACLVPWQLWLNAWQHEIPSVLMGKYGAYGPWVAEGFREGGIGFARDVAMQNVRAVYRFVSYVFMPMAPVWPRALAFVAVCAVAAIGLGTLVKRATVTALFLAGYAAVILVWPFEPERFMLALWPLLTLCGLAGLQVVWRWHPARLPMRGLRHLIMISTAVVVAGFATYNVRGYRHQWWTSVQRDAGQRAKPIVEWVASATQPSDVLMTDDDLMVFLYAGRRAMPSLAFLPKDHVQSPSDEDNIAAVRLMIDAYHPRSYITTSARGQVVAEALTKGQTPLLRRHVVIQHAFIYERISQ